MCACVCMCVCMCVCACVGVYVRWESVSSRHCNTTVTAIGFWLLTQADIVPLASHAGDELGSTVSPKGRDKNARARAVTPGSDGDDAIDDGDDVDADQPDGSTLYVCELCPYTTPYEHSYLCHHGQAHDGGDDGHGSKCGAKRLYKCVHCPHMGTQKPSLKLHSRRRHNDGESDPVPVPPLACPRCNFTSMLKPEVRKHMTELHEMTVSDFPTELRPMPPPGTPRPVVLWWRGCGRGRVDGVSTR